MKKQSGRKNEKKDCCPGDATACCDEAATVRGARVKRIVSSLVLVAAALLIAYQLVSDRRAAARAGETSFNIGGQVAEEAQAAGLSTVLCGETLDSLKSLDRVAAAKDVAFILLPGADAAVDGKVAAEVKAIVDKLSAQGKRVVAFTMEKGASDHGLLVKNFSVQALPAVVVLGRGCQSLAVSGEVSEEKLLRAFLLASRPGSSCAPGACGAKKK